MYSPAGVTSAIFWSWKWGELTGNKEDISLFRSGGPIGELQSRKTHKVNPVDADKIVVLTSCERIMFLVLAEGLEKQIAMPQLCLLRVHIRKPIAAGADGGKSIYITARTATPGDSKFSRLLPVLVRHKFSLAGKKPTHICVLVSEETKNKGVD